MSEADYRAYQRAHGGGSAPQDEVAISLDGDEHFGHHGTFDFIDNAVNRSSGTIRARATVANPDLAITPGQFARLRVPNERPGPALLLPPAAIVPDQSRQVVMTVGSDGTVTPKPVEIGGLYRGLRMVRRGLTAEDTVVIDGIVRVKPGAKVTPTAGTIAADKAPLVANPAGLPDHGRSVAAGCDAGAHREGHAAGGGHHILKTPGIEHVASFAGLDATTFTIGSNSGTIFPACPRFTTIS